MGPDERLRRYQEVGADFIEAARARAEEFLRDIGALGEATGRQAGTTVGDLRDSGRRGTDQLFELIRREIAAQLSGLGLATKADLSDLERRLTGGSAAPAGGTKPAAEKAAARKAATEKAATTKAAATKAAAPKKAATKKAAGGAAKKAAAARKAPTARKAAAAKSSAASKSAAAKAASRTATAARKAVRKTGGTTS
ncbi:MAG TPA: hypothetical protein VFN60_12655 [Acidimicrobiales bacterium]|nr:hypothetical protein [Acidimicrobiales bacterium]